MGYKPKIITGKVTGTGWPIDGHVLYFSMWDYDNYDSWHLYGWDDADDEAVMETMFITEEKAGLCLYDTLETFAEVWRAGGSRGAVCCSVGRGRRGPPPERSVYRATGRPARAKREKRKK